MRQRRTAVFAAVSAFVAAAAPAAHGATERLYEAPLEITGALAFTWQGDQARGCRDVGMCDTTGTITWSPGAGGSITLRRTSAGFRLTENGQAALDGAHQAIARTERGDRIACVDAIPQDLGGLGLRGPVLTLGQGFFGSLGTLSSGRCAGPRPTDLRSLLPSARIDTARLASGQSLDFTGRRAFTAGALSGEVVSTVRMALGTPRRSRSSVSFSVGTGAAPGRVRHVETLRLSYEIRRVSGAVSLAYEGLRDPDCDALDACGLRGTIEHAVGGGRGTLEVFASRRRPRGTRVSLRRSLAALRAGRLPFQAFASVDGLTGTTAQRSLRDDGDHCTDAVSGIEATLGATVRRVPTRRIELRLSPDGGDGDLDPLRTRCPGPSRTDMFGTTSLGLGRIPVGALGTPALRVALRRAGGFLSGAYIGSRRSDVLVELRLRRASAELVTERSG